MVRTFLIHTEENNWEVTTRRDRHKKQQKVCGGIDGAWERVCVHMCWMHVRWCTGACTRPKMCGIESRGECMSVSRWEKEAEREDHFRTTLPENSGAKFKFRYLHFFVNYLPFRFSNQKEWNNQKCCKNSLKLHALFFTLQPVFPALKTFSKIALHRFMANHRPLATVHHK